MNSNVGQEDDEAKQQEDDNCYKILGCPEDVSQQDLKKRYYDLALKVIVRHVKTCFQEALTQ